MNHKQRRILEAVYTTPTKPDILWNDIESLLSALGADISYGAGPRVRCFLNGVIAVFHRPHPERITNKGTVESVRKFLTRAGILLDQ